MLRRRLMGQGLYYVATGVWPLISLRSFELVTGPKLEGWLVKTVGVLVSVIGGVLVIGARRDPPASEVQLLAGASAVALAGIDTIYVAKGRIAPIYLLDAVVEVALAAGIVFAAGAARPARSLGGLPQVRRGTVARGRRFTR